MKNKLNSCFYLLAFVLCISILSCKTTKNTSPEIGFWQLESKSGGITGRNQTAESIGFTQKMILVKNGTYLFLQNDTIIEKGLYTLLMGKTIFKTEAQQLIKFSSGKSLVIMKLDLERLELTENYNDGFGYAYKKTEKINYTKLPERIQN